MLRSNKHGSCLPTVSRENPFYERTQIQSSEKLVSRPKIFGKLQKAAERQKFMLLTGYMDVTV